MKGIKCTQLQDDYHGIMDTNRVNYWNNGVREGLSRGRFGGRGSGGWSGGRCCGRVRQGGQGQGGCGGRGIGGYNRNEGKHPHIYLSWLPNDIELNNLTFDNKKWHNEFTQEQRNTIMALQNFYNKNRHINYMNRCVDYQHKQCQGGGNYNQNDDNSSFGGL